MSDLTDWITALSTVGATIGTVGAVVTSLWLARKGDRDAGRRDARRQADRVSAWIIPYDGKQDRGSQGIVYVGLSIRNASDLPVYDLIAEVVGAQGGRRTAVGDNLENNITLGAFVGTVPPGEAKTRIATHGRGMNVRFGIELAFRDAAGRCWLRHGDGTLVPIDKEPVDLFGLPRPLSWQSG